MQPYISCYQRGSSCHNCLFFLDIDTAGIRGWFWIPCGNNNYNNAWLIVSISPDLQKDVCKHDLASLPHDSSTIGRSGCLETLGSNNTHSTCLGSLVWKTQSKTRSNPRSYLLKMEMRENVIFFIWLHLDISCFFTGLTHLKMKYTLFQAPVSVCRINSEWLICWPQITGHYLYFQAGLKSKAEEKGQNGV